MFFRSLPLLGISENFFSNYYAKFANYYSELTQESHPLSALSILAQNREELINYRREYTIQTKDYAKMYLKSEFVDDAQEVLSEAYSTAIEIDDISKRTPSLSLLTKSNQERFHSAVQEFMQESYTGEFFTDKIFRQLEEHHKVGVKVEAIKMIIAEVLRLDYPDELSKELTDTQKEKIENERGAGRKFSDALEQSLVEELVPKWLRKAKANEDGYETLIHRTEKKNGQPNIRQIALKFFEEKHVDPREMSLDAVQDRIKRVI